MPTYGVFISDTASPYLTSLARGFNNQTWRDSLGEAGVRIVADHLADLNMDSQRHKTAKRLGAEPSGLYADMSRATSFAPSEEGVVVSINHVAAAQRYHGGIITPTGGRTYLTIPAMADAYGVRARDAGIQLSFAIMPDPDLGGALRPTLVAKDPVLKEVGRKRKDGSRRTTVAKNAGIWYWLVESVETNPDPGVLPEDEQMLKAFDAALNDWLQGIAA